MMSATGNPLDSILQMLKGQPGGVPPVLGRVLDPSQQVQSSAPTQVPNPNQQAPDPSQIPPQPDMSQMGTGIRPGSQALPDNAQPPPLPQGQTKAHKLMQILQGGLVGGLSGLAANSQTYAQTGRNAGFGGGVGAAFTQSLPFLQKLQQSELQQKQAQTGVLQSEAGMVDIPGVGQMPGWLAKTMGPAALRALAMQNVQSQKSDTAESIQGQKSQSAKDIQGMKGAQAMDVERMKFAIQNGQVSRVEDGIDPQTGKPAKIAYSRTGQMIGVLPGSLPSSAFLPTDTDTTEYRDDGNGNILALPKRTTKSVAIPPAQAPMGQAGPPSGQGALPAAMPQTGGASKVLAAALRTGGGPRVVAPGKPVGMVTGTSSDFRQIAGTPQELQAAGATGVTKLEAADASKVSIARQMTGPGGLFANAESDLAAFKPEELTALGARWNEFQTGTLGTGDKRYAALRTDLALLSTALMQAHVGSKGGEHIMDHFADLANAGKMNGDILKTAISTERRYVEEKAMRPTAVGGTQGGGQGARRVIDLTK